MRHALLLAIFISFISVLAIPVQATILDWHPIGYIKWVYTYTNQNVTQISLYNNSLGILAHGLSYLHGNANMIRTVDLNTGSTLYSCHFAKPYTDYYRGLKYTGNEYWVTSTTTGKAIFVNSLNATKSDCAIIGSPLTLWSTENKNVTEQFENFNKTCSSRSMCPFIFGRMDSDENTTISEMVAWSDGSSQYSNETALTLLNDSYVFAGYSNGFLYLQHKNSSLDPHIALYNYSTGEYMASYNLTAMFNMTFNNTDPLQFVIAPYNNHTSTHKLMWVGEWDPNVNPYFNPVLNLYLVDLGGNFGGGVGGVGGYGNETLPENPTLTDYTGYYVGRTLGVSDTGARTFVSLLISFIFMVFVAGYLGLKHVQHAFLIGILTFLVFISIFTLVFGWLATWVFGILIVLFGALTFGMLTGKIGGG